MLLLLISLSHLVDIENVILIGAIIIWICHESLVTELLTISSDLQKNKTWNLLITGPLWGEQLTI